MNSLLWAMRVIAAVLYLLTGRDEREFDETRPFFHDTQPFIRKS